MENNENLRQLQNSVEVVGKLKSKQLEVKTSKKGNEYMSGSLVVASVIGDKINEQQIKVFIMKSSKLFKGIETVMNEYKSVEEVGSEEADRIRVTGELKLNEYYNNNGNFVQFNEIKGVFFNRVEEDVPDKSIATIETVVEEFVDIVDNDGLPTGDKTVKGFTVGWGNDVVELRNTIVRSDLAEAMQNLYVPGSTGQLTFQLNNYVEVEEPEEQEVDASHGFGSSEKVESNVAKKYVNNIEVIGGGVPYFGTKEYTEDEIQQAKQVRELKLQSLNEPAPSTPVQRQTGFPESQPKQQQSQTEASPFTTSVPESGMPDF